MVPINSRSIAFRFLGVLLFTFGSVFAQDFSYQIRKAIFSKRQFFWPGIQASEKSLPLNLIAKSKATSQPVRLGVLPINIRDYWESIPCDSCHRLSVNGMEFYLENYLKDKLGNRFPKAKIELIAPQFQLLENQKIDLLAYLDSLALPWAQWFPDSSEVLIYWPQIGRAHV